MKKEIADLLMTILSYAYCDNCNNKNESENCDDCHRKYQSWCLSQDVADELAEQIVEIFNRKE